MATEKETIILDLKVDQGSAITELEQTKKVIIGVKEEQQKLNKAYKDGEITQEEYAKGLVRVEGVLKTSQSQYNNIQKSVTGVKTQMDKLIESNKKISSEFQNAANNIRVAGVSVGDVTTKLAAFANPATAAVGIVTALGAAYSRSTVGAKDLEFAQNQLSAATTVITNSFALMISSAEDGEGAISKFVNSILFKISPAVAAVADASARAIENMEQVQRNSALVQAAISERLAENADLRTDIANTELTITQRTAAAQKVLDNITQNTNEKLASINALIDARKRLIEDAEKKEGAINLLIAERSALTAAEARDKSKLEKQVNSILNAEKKRTEEVAKAIQLQNEQDQRRKNTFDFQSFDEQPVQESENPIFDSVVEFRTAEEIKRDEALKTAKQNEDNQIAQTAFEKQQLDERLAAQSLYFAAAAEVAATFFGQGSAAYKALALSQNTIDTYRAASAALAPPPTGAGPLFGPALAAITIATGLANAVQITRAAGGGNFVTKGPALMLVGDNPGGRERVTVEPLSGRGQTRVAGNRIAMAGGGTLTTGFDDGGITKNGATAQMMQALMFTNAIKNLPKPVVGVKQFVDVQNSLEVTQSVAQA